MASAAATIALSGGDLVPKLNGDVQLPSHQIKADRMDIQGWKQAASKTSMNQAEYMTLVGDRARDAEFIMRDPFVALSTDVSPEGCGVMLKPVMDSSGNHQKDKDGKLRYTATQLQQANFGYDPNVTAADMDGFYWAIMKGDSNITQCVPKNKRGAREKDLKEREKLFLKQLSRMEHIWSLKQAAEDSGKAGASASEVARLSEAFNFLASDTAAQDMLYGESSASHAARVEALKELYEAKAARYPRTLAWLKVSGVAEKFAKDTLSCAKQMQKDGCGTTSSASGSGQCGWVEHQTPFGKKGICVPPPSTYTDFDASVKKAPKQRSSAEAAAVDTWLAAAAEEEARSQKQDNGWYAQIEKARKSKGVQSPVDSRLESLFAISGGADAPPSVFSTAMSDASGIDNMHIF